MKITKNSFYICQTSVVLSFYQGSTISIKSLYMSTYVYQNFSICDVRGKIPKSKSLFLFMVAHLVNVKLGLMDWFF